jgi:hypothetical protein
VWKKKVIEIGKPSQALFMSPLVFLTIYNKTTFLFIIFESLYLSMDLVTDHHLRCRVCELNPFPEVLDISSEWMVKREELTILVQRRKLANPL